MFKAGDIVCFICKDGSFGAAKVLRVDSTDMLPAPQSVFHFLIYKERFVMPPASSVLPFTPFISHLPIMESGVSRSGCMFIRWEEVKEATEMEGYFVWRECFFSGDAGIFDLSLDDAIAMMIEASRNG